MPPTAAEAPGRRRLLAVGDVQTGYHHDSLSHALATLDLLGRGAGDWVTTLRTDSQLITREPIVGQGAKYQGRSVNARSLGAYDALFLLPSGAGTLGEQQKADLLAFVHDDGKGLVLGHAAIVGFFDWPAFGALAGARLGGEIARQATILVDDPALPGAQAFDARVFPFEEQHPLVAAPYTPGAVQVVMRLDPASVPPTTRGWREDGDYPLVWMRHYGKGRVYHIGWGHEATTWDDPRFQRLVIEGVRWAMGEPVGP